MMVAAAASSDVVTVLVVEDDPDSRDALTRYLRGAGCMARAVASVGEALLYLEEWEPSHVLLDLALPDAGGIVLLRAIRRRELPVRVALVTASGPGSHGVEQALLWEPDAVFHKPVVFTDIEAWLRKP